MVLASDLTGKILHYFTEDRGLSPDYIQRYGEKNEILAIKNFVFDFSKTKGKNLEIILTPPEDFNLRSCLKWIESRDSIKDPRISERLKMKIKKSSAYFGKKEFGENKEGYSFTAEIPSENSEKVAVKLSNYLIMPILSYPHE